MILEKVNNNVGKLVGEMQESDKKQRKKDSKCKYLKNVKAQHQIWLHTLSEGVNSLHRSAKGWVDRLAPGTINTWDLLKKAFIQRYCPPSMKAKQLEDIHNFKQEEDESLYQAWEKYNGMLYKCPTYDINNHQKIILKMADRTTSRMSKEKYKKKKNSSKQVGLADLVNKLENLGQDIKKLKENVHAVQVGCQICLLDSHAPISGIRPAQALITIQTMADHSQKWHDGTTRRNIGNSSSKDRLAALVNKLDNMGRDMKKLKESVHAIQVGCQISEGPHLDKDCPLNEEVKQVEEVRYGELRRTTPFNGNNGGKFHVGPLGYYTKIDNHSPYGKKRQSLEELLAKHQEESARRITTDHGTSGLNKLYGVSFISRPESETPEVLQHQLAPKELNPGSFTLPCMIGKFNFYAMADLGASINVMPRSIFKHLHLTNLKKTNMLCEMADMSKKAPLGIVENVLVKIDKFLFPSNFVIIENTLFETTILRRPFLATIHAEIDVFAGKISLGINEDRISFETMRKDHNYTNPSENFFMVRPQSPAQSHNQIDYEESGEWLKFNNRNFSHDSRKEFRKRFSEIRIKEIECPEGLDFEEFGALHEGIALQNLNQFCHVVREYVMEFLSSFTFKDHIEELNAADTMVFQLGEERGSMTMRQFIQALGLMMEGFNVDVPLACGQVFVYCEKAKGSMWKSDLWGHNLIGRIASSQYKGWYWWSMVAEIPEVAWDDDAFRSSPHDHTRYDGTCYSYVSNIPDLGVQQGVNFMSGTPGYSIAPSLSASQFGIFGDAHPSTSRNQDDMNED
ncbi:zinc knuckle CX2CX4HX4C containing protein [Tanacetum coccineum]